MHHRDVLDGLARLLRTDVEQLDRDELDATVALASRVRAWHDSFDLRCARRASELQRTGASAGAEAMFGRAGKRSAKEGSTIAERAQLGEQLPAFGHGLAAGEVSAGHLDVLASVRARLDDETTRRFDAREAELLAFAAHERVDVFARRCRELATQLTPAATDADELDLQRARANVKRWVDKSTGMHHSHLELDPLRDATLWNAVNAALGTLRQRDGNARTPWQQMQVDAFVAAVQGGAIVEPSTDGSRPCATADDTLRRIEQRVPEVTVLVDYQVLLSRMHDHGICETDDGVPLPVSTVRRLCCDAEVIPAVLGGSGELLEMGRSARTVNRAQRRALRAMHRTCAHHHCTVAFSACKIHHVRWWVRDRGPTDIDNLLPLCERHHHLVHEGRWTVTITPERVATWTRPDGTIDHRGSTIDRRAMPSNGRVPAPESGHADHVVADRRPADRPMIS